LGGGFHELIRQLIVVMEQMPKAMTNSPIQTVVEWHAGPFHYRQERRWILA
jgi:hypothetical protein